MKGGSTISLPTVALAIFVLCGTQRGFSQCDSTAGGFSISVEIIAEDTGVIEGLDIDSNGVCDTDDQLHCGPGTEWDAELGLCIISCPTDINIDGATAIGDLLLLLASFASLCSGTE